MITKVQPNQKQTRPPTVTFRPGTLADSFTVYKIFEQTILDLSERFGQETISGGQEEAALRRLWNKRRPLFEHLAETAAHFWLAERDGQAIGYARSVMRGKLQELTEFFVLPGEQSVGVGRELLKRAFPDVGAEQRAIVATPDSRALVRYLKAAVYPRFPIGYFSRPVQVRTVTTDLTIRPIEGSAADLTALGRLDKIILGHQRDVDQAWLLAQRQGYLYTRAGEAVGYGYVGANSGPFALLDERDFSAVLAHAESEAAVRGLDFGVEVPLINRVAVDYLLSHGYRMEPFITLFMSDVPFGKFENYILPSPPFFV